MLGRLTLEKKKNAQEKKYVRICMHLYMYMNMNALKGEEKKDNSLCRGVNSFLS